MKLITFIKIYLSVFFSVITFLTMRYVSADIVVFKKYGGERSIILAVLLLILFYIVLYISIFIVPGGLSRDEYNIQKRIVFTVCLVCLYILSVFFTRTAINEGLSTFIHFHWAEKKSFVVECLIDKKIDFTFSNNSCPNGLDIYLHVNDDIYSSRVCGIDRRLWSGLPERGLVLVHGDVSRYGFNYNKNSFEQVNSL